MGNPILSRYFSTKNWIKKDREKKRWEDKNGFCYGNNERAI